MAAEADHFQEDDTQFLKSHGIYQQDDRDLRKTGKRYIFMVRCRIPGGVLTSAQYLACDELAARYANNTLRVTSRQGLQFHGVVKGGLRALVKAINDTLLGTLAACGDNNRNVMAPSAPPTNQLEPDPDDLTGDAAALAAEGADWIVFASALAIEHIHHRFDLPALMSRFPATRLALASQSIQWALDHLALAPSALAPSAIAHPDNVPDLVHQIIQADSSPTSLPASFPQPPQLEPALAL